MAREGLMDDCGYNFEPTEAEERAWNEGYEQGMADAKKFEKDCKKCIFFVFREDKIEEIKKQGKADMLEEIIQWLKDIDLVTYNRLLDFLGDKLQELKEQKDG